MQNRRIINRVFASVGAKIAPTITSNSFLSVGSHIHQGGWSAIVPHTFEHLFGDASMRVLGLIEPTHTEAIGLVFSARDPLTPMANAFLSSSLDLRFPEHDLADRV